MDFRDALVLFRKSRWFRVFYVTILAFLASTLILLPFSVLLLPVSLLVIPYWIRERGYRKYIVNGVAAILGGVLILAATSAASITGRPVSPVLSGARANVQLTNGTVEPFQGAPGQQFTFTVDIRTTANVTPADVAVWLNLSFFDAPLRLVEGPGLAMAAANASDLNLRDGKRYSVLAPVLEHVYIFSFSARVNVSPMPVYAVTVTDTGPLVVGFGAFFVLFALLAAQFAIFPTIVYFLALVFHKFFRRSQRARQKVAPPGPEEPTVSDRGYTCTSCGADVPEDATRCPSCGAVFEEGPEVPPADRATTTEGRDESR